MNDRIAEKDAKAIAEGFKVCLFKYLNGVGHVHGVAPSHITLDEYEQRKGDHLFRARVTLRQFTDSWLLPIDSEEGKIKV